MTLASPTPSSCVNQELEVPKEPFFLSLANLLIPSQWWRDIFAIPSPTVVFSLPGPYPSEALEGNQRQLGSRCHMAVWGPRVPPEGRLFGGPSLGHALHWICCQIEDPRVLFFFQRGSDLPWSDHLHVPRSSLGTSRSSSSIAAQSLRTAASTVALGRRLFQAPLPPSVLLS